ncbi:MAG: TetR/AcrR family transcriptional regulator [Anaeromusa sp.]|uniref:TetR/AcrR family transcriptional regulator n=1 Tax=Anaeromusa sp. TaxID=1872520 RepID=UPI002B215932|nr:TetR/AcrR family transcriptional regulator [Anaeromusa sp.]MEA4835683.1 TetR/AcrR family transcriptional regulator [Anaeromusa sp.]NCB76051.1 TetR/AcrR family transcriptional regulator [Negativicutes bacterium]
MRSRKTTEIRREEILRAALFIVEQQGLDNLNTNAIAALIQLVPSAIYRHFKNKEEIIAALIDFIGERLQQNLQQATTQEGTALERLKSLFELHVKLLQEEPSIPRILYSLISSERNQELKKKMLAEIDAYVYETKKLLLQGKKAGEINPAVDVAAAAMMFLGMIQPLVILSQENKDVLDEYPQKLWQCYQRAIAF